MNSSISKSADGKVEISTQRLLLRGARETDAESMFEAFSDPEVMRYWSSLPHENVETTKDRIKEGMVESESNGVTDFIICLKPDLKPIGKIGVWRDEEIGFLLARSQWRKGIAQEAFGGILPYLFNERKLEQITADTDPRNEASIGLLQKLGFSIFDFKKNTWQVGEVWVDSTYLKLTKSDWEKRQ